MNLFPGFIRSNYTFYKLFSIEFTFRLNSETVKPFAGFFGLDLGDGVGIGLGLSASKSIFISDGIIVGAGVVSSGCSSSSRGEIGENNAECDSSCVAG